MKQPSNILALDTSTDACVVALQRGGAVEERFSITPREHNRQLLPMVMELLRLAGLSPGELELLIFGRGPGSFTGIRIATGVIQGLAYGLSIPVVPLSTLACLAQGRLRCEGDSQIAVAMQARNEEIYWGCYVCEEDAVIAVGEERLIDCRNASLPCGGRWVGIGSGWRHRELIETSLGVQMAGVEEQVHPRGPDLLSLGVREHLLGRSVGALEATPVYLREKVAAKSSEG